MRYYWVQRGTNGYKELHLKVIKIFKTKQLSFNFYFLFLFLLHFYTNKIFYVKMRYYWVQRGTNGYKELHLKVIKIFETKQLSFIFYFFFLFLLYFYTNKAFSVKMCYYWVQCVTSGYKELQLRVFDIFITKR